MAARITEQDVRDIMGDKDFSGFSIDAFILSANSVVSNAFRNSVIADAAFLKMIETWFCAHLIASVHFKEVEEEKLGDATVKYAGKFDSGLDSTSYGKMVKQLDYTGLMEASNKSKMKITAIKQVE